MENHLSSDQNLQKIIGTPFNVEIKPLGPGGQAHASPIWG